MYILFALVVAILAYAIASVALPISRRRVRPMVVLAGASLAIFVAFLVAFNFLSRAVGIDPGPFHGVSYNIPQDYMARGLAGVAVLVVYALACLAPILGVGVASRMQQP